MTHNQETRGEIPSGISPTAVRFDRRVLVRRGAALGAGLAGVGALAWRGLAAQQASPSPATSPVASPTTGQDATPTIVAAANAFLATLDSSQKSSVLFDWSNTAQKQRWSNLPQGLFQRDGLMWGNLGQQAQDAWLKLMQATLSTEGYHRVVAEWHADDALASQQGSGGIPSASGFGGTPPAGGSGTGTVPAGGPGGGGGMSFGRQYYWVALIGNPSETNPWQWQWGGHHVTVNATIVGSHLSLTPSFIGVQPATYTDASGTTVRPLGDIDDEGFTLINALDATQRQAAILGNTYVDLVLGPGQDGKTIQPEGLPASKMTTGQKTAFVHLIAHYTGLANDAAAAARAAEIQANLDQTYLAWYGPTTKGSAAYFRVTGPTIVIEYSPQQQLSNNPADHIHGIYRDPTNDYGAKYTGIEIAS